MPANQRLPAKEQRGFVPPEYGGMLRSAQQYAQPR
jgi:hypothetical protein